MRKKGWTRNENPEKMPVITAGIEMTRNTRVGNAEEKLTGGNGVADESKSASLVIDFIKNKFRRG